MIPFLLLTALLLHPGDIPMNSTDRQRDGFRGPVRSYSEECVSTDTTARQSTEKATYSPDGLMLERRRTLSDNQELVTTYSYDPQHRLVAESVGRPGQPVTTQSYTYDEQDQRTKNVDFPAFPRDPNRNVAVAAIPWEDSTLFYQPYEGGTLTTIYNANSKAVEGDFRDLEGRLVTKFLREFDARGNVVNEKLENPPDAAAAWISSKLDSEPDLGQFNDTQKQALAAFMASEFLAAKGKYKYDNQGRLLEKHATRGAIPAEITRYEYNDQGDISTQTILSMQPDSREWSMDEQGKMTVTCQNPPASQTAASQYYKSYEYIYDTNGNWTRRITKHRMKLDEPWTETQVTTREIKYY